MINVSHFLFVNNITDIISFLSYKVKDFEVQKSGKCSCLI